MGRDSLSLGSGSVSQISEDGPSPRESALMGPTDSQPALKDCATRCQDLGAWKFIALAGLGSAVGDVLNFMAQPYLTGAAVTLLEQLGSLVVAAWSMLILSARYSAQE